MNFKTQMYKGILVRLINRQYQGCKAMRFTLNNTNQNIWIPKKHLCKDGTIKQGEDIDYVFLKAKINVELSGASLVQIRRQHNG